MKQFLLLLIVGIFCFVILACEKENKETVPGTLYISINSSPDTKTDISQTQQQDNNIETLDVFIFRNNGKEDSGVLDGFKHFEGEALGNLTNLAVKTTTGAKKICVVANIHKSDLQGITDLQSFTEIISLLTDEKHRSFTMTGSADATLGITTSVSLSLKRLVAKVSLTGIKADFTGTPYQGKSISNVKVYLVNIKGNKYISTGLKPGNELILNNKTAVASDIAACAQTGLIYDEIAGEIGIGGYSKEHYYYCYQNDIAQETETEKFTRLTIQCDIAGKTYYYPININQEGTGYVAGNDHHGLKRNTSYSISVVIFRPGSTDPDIPVTLGTVSTTITIDNWSSTPVSNVDF